ncbi:hypothetical protein ACFFWB_27525 [Flavobacterium procerum]
MEKYDEKYGWFFWAETARLEAGVFINGMAIPKIPTNRTNLKGLKTRVF